MGCRWEIGVFGAGDELVDAAWFTDAAQRLMAADEIVVTRERKGAMVTDDIRPGIAALTAGSRANGTPILIAELDTGVGRSIRPAELGLALELPVTRLDVRRTHQWIARDGGRVEPLSETSSDGRPFLLRVPADATAASASA